MNPEIAAVPRGASIAANGCSYRVVGAGSPTLVFVHGFGCAGEDWDDIIEILGGEFACLSLDLPGHGASAQPKEGTIETFASAVSDVISEALRGPVVLVGHSLGTKIIRACYRESAGSVAGLVLVDGSTYVGNADTLIAGLKSDIERQGMERYLRTLFGGMFVPGTDLALIKRMTERAMRLPPNLARDVLISSIRWDTEVGDGVLRALRVPVLLLQSTYFRPGIGRTFMSRDTETAFMAKIANLVGHAESQILTGIGHFPMIEAPQDIAGRIARFVRQAVLDNQAPASS